MPEKNWADVIAYLAQKEIDRRTKVTRKFPAQSTGASGKSSQARRASAKSKKSSKSQTKGSNVEQSDVQSSHTQASAGQGVNIQMADIPNSTTQLSDQQETSNNLATRVEGSPDAHILSVRSYVDQAENSIPPETFNRRYVRKSISLNVRKEVLNRDKCCQFKDSKTGKICGNTRFAQIDHIQSIWAGGTNDPLNLQQLCAKHNQYKYRKEAGYSH